MHLTNKTDISDGKSIPSGSGTCHGYMVQARYNYSVPKDIAGLLIDNRWQTIHPEPARVGIPRPRYLRHELVAASCMTRSEAEAIRWWLICTADATDVCGSLCLETRIVECQIKYEFSSTPVAYLDAIDGRGDLPDDMQETQPETDTQ